MKFKIIQEFADGFRAAVYPEEHLKLNAILDLLYNKHFHRDDTEAVELYCLIGKSERTICLVYLAGTKRFLAAGHLSPDINHGIRMCNSFNKLNKKYFGENLPSDLQKNVKEENDEPSEQPPQADVFPIDDKTKKEIEKILGIKPDEYTKEYQVDWKKAAKKLKGGE